MGRAHSRLAFARPPNADYGCSGVGCAPELRTFSTKISLQVFGPATPEQCNKVARGDGLMLGTARRCDGELELCTLGCSSRSPKASDYERHSAARLHWPVCAAARHHTCICRTVTYEVCATDTPDSCTCVVAAAQRDLDLLPIGTRVSGPGLMFCLWQSHIFGCERA
jgi:hypothetical protein